MCLRAQSDGRVIAPEQIEAAVKAVSSWGSGLFILGCFILLFRSLLLNVVAGLIWQRGTLSLDQPLLISGRPSRLVRSGAFRTVFYMEDVQSKMVVPNSQLATLTVELILGRHDDE